MERNLLLRRLYKLGDFENLTVEDTLTGIPDDLANNLDLLTNLQYLQMVRTEKVLYKYYELKTKTQNLSTEDAIALLEKMENVVYKKISDILHTKINLEMKGK